ncbi:MAG: hypothetical protein RR506_03090 [Akkermansia sp.]
MKNPVFNTDINQFTNRLASGSGFLTMAPVLDENKAVSIDCLLILIQKCVVIQKIVEYFAFQKEEWISIK